jgi:hypothetical protein
VVTPTSFAVWWHRPMGQKYPEKPQDFALAFALIRAECRLSRIAKLAIFRYTGPESCAV